MQILPSASTRSPLTFEVYNKALGKPGCPPFPLAQTAAGSCWHPTLFCLGLSVSPGKEPRHGARNLQEVFAPFGLEALHDLLDGLGAIPVADEEGILGVHHDEVVYAAGRDEPPPAEEGAVPRVQ
jgi:hypothetical protein